MMPAAAECIFAPDEFGLLVETAIHAGHHREPSIAKTDPAVVHGPYVKAAQIEQKWQISGAQVLIAGCRACQREVSGTR